MLRRRATAAAAPKARKPALDDAALLAELGVPPDAPHDQLDEESLLQQIHGAAATAPRARGTTLILVHAALSGGDEQEAELLRLLDESSSDDVEAALLRELGISDARQLLLDSSPHGPAAAARQVKLAPAGRAQDAASLEAAVLVAKREAVAHKQAGRLEEARAALRLSKDLQRQLDAVLVTHEASRSAGMTVREGPPRAETVALEAEDELQESVALEEEDPVLLAQMHALLHACSNSSAAEPSPEGVDTCRAQPTLEPSPPSAAARGAQEPSPPPVVAPAPQSSGANTDVAIPTHDDVLAAKREALALKRAGRLVEAKAALARAKELERRRSEAGVS